MAYGFKTGGRTAGTLNKRTQDMLDEITSTGETPLQYMLRVMRNPEASPAQRDAMAIAAAFIPSWPRSMPPLRKSKISSA